MRRRRLPTVAAPPASVVRPFWSVMIPTYDADALLADALRSVLAQDPGPARMQICVVDDASTVGDAAAAVAAIAGDRVQVVRQPHNVGAPSNFTTCIRRSVGHWVHILHADDLVHPGFYDAFGAAVATHACVMAVGRSRVVDGDGSQLGETDRLAATDGLLVRARQTIACDHPLNFAATVVRRSAYEQVGGFDPDLPHANDWDMWCRLASIGAVAVVETGAPLATYRRHGATDTERLRTSMIWLTDCLTAIDRIASDGPDRESGRAVIRHTHRWLAADAVRMAERCRAGGHRRLALRNALWAARLDRTQARWALGFARDLLTS